MSVLVPPPSPVTIRRSKIERPVVTGQWVRRHQVESQLDRSFSRILTVISAPTGHGKTSTIVSWLQVRDINAAWLNIDRHDATLTTFASHLAAALDRIAPGIMTSLFALLAVPDRLPPHELGERFGEALYDLDQDVVLVLDDFHEADRGAVAKFVPGLVEAAPRRLHTILSSCRPPSFPLSRFRTTGGVEELGSEALRFTARETSELLHLESGDVVNPDVAAAIQESVGGWPAAIKLIAIGRGASEGNYPHAASGERQDQLILNYLAEEVLARLRPAHRDLLVRVSLVDRFNSSLLEALAVGHGGAPLTRDELMHLRGLELYREIPGLDEPWYAYHPVFREALRSELERTTCPEAIADVRRSAARWFAAAGLTREAIQHLVAAGDLFAAETLIESRLSTAFDAEDWQSVATWLRIIPSSHVQKRPQLLLASAWVAYLSGREARVADVLRTVRSLPNRATVTEEQRAEISLIADVSANDSEGWVKTAEAAIAHVSPRRRYHYGYAHLTLGLGLVTAGREDEALARLANFADREGERIDAASIRGYLGRVFVLWHSGRLARCEQAAGDVFQLAQMNALPVSAGWGATFLGIIAHERGELTRAAHHLEVVIAGAERLHFASVRESFFTQILAYEAQGMREEATRAITRIRELAIASETLHQIELVDSFAARIALMRGDLVSAQRWLDASLPTLLANDLNNVHNPRLTRAKVLVALGTRDELAEADHLLAEFVDYAQAKHMALARLEGLAVQALLHEVKGDRALATRVLRESLAIAAPEGIVQRYAYLGPTLAPILRRLLAQRDPVPHARNVLGSLDAMLAAQAGASKEAEAIHSDLFASPLTARELEILASLALRLTNNEIAEKFFISPITVKHHVANISGKLAVSGRRAAVERARELKLIA